MKCPECGDDIKKHSTFGCTASLDELGKPYCECEKPIGELIDLLQAERDEAVGLLSWITTKETAGRPFSLQPIKDFLIKIK